MKAQFSVAALLLLSLLFLAGCASIIKGETQVITVTSNVPDALIEMNGVKLGHTPFKGNVKRGQIGQIRVSKQGYVASTVEIKKERNSLFSSFGNVGLGLTIGAVPLSPVISTANSGDAGMASTGATFGQASIFAALFVAILGPPLFTTTDVLSSASWEYSPSEFYVQLKEEGQSLLDYLNELAIRYFSTMNHSQIAIDAGSEEHGEYAKALANILETRMSKEAAKRSINDALEKSRGDQLVFANELMLSFNP
jgi:hypothetical protein